MSSREGARLDSCTNPTLTSLSWVELDAEALAQNLGVLRTKIGPNSKLIAVVKADAYGHGAAQVAKVALANGAWGLAVSSVEEALPLRESGVVAPILLLNHLPTPEAIRLALKLDLTASVYDSEIAKAYDAGVRRARSAHDSESSTQRSSDVCPKLKVHLKIDTGMGRLGVGIEDVDGFFRLVRDLPGLQVEGIYSHFARADEPNVDTTTSQISAFEGVLKRARELGLSFRIVHVANSAAMLSRSDSLYDRVRVGLALYGLSPFENDGAGQADGLRPVLTWKTRVAQVKPLPKGSPVGYGGTYRTVADPERLAILPVGYADGIRRSPLPWKTALVGGRFVPLVGRVCMEKIVVDVMALTSPPKVGDEVVLIGRQGDHRQGAQDVARDVGTSPYEILCSVGARVPRVWV